MSGGCGTIQMEPLVPLWERMFAAEAELNRTPGSNKAAWDAAEARYLEAQDQLLTTPPTTSFGIALKLKLLAHVEDHEHQGPDTSNIEACIVRDLIRQLTGEADWVSPTYDVS